MMEICVRGQSTLRQCATSYCDNSYDALNKFRNELMDQQFSQYLAPSDFHLFQNLKRLDNNVLKETLTDWLPLQVTDFCDDSIHKLMPRLNKYVDVNGDYVGK